MRFTTGFRRPVLFAAFLAAGACVTVPSPVRSAGPCVLLRPGTLGISTARVELAPGESVQLPRPAFFVAPYQAPDTLATNCGVQWSVAGDATIGSTGFLTIGQDATPGSTVLISARVDTLVARQNVLVIDPAPNPLAGTWTQSEPPMCERGYRPNDAMVRELVFHRGPTFTVTRMPFESYRDYWGTYTYDVATGRLELTVDGGNSRPGFQTTTLTARVVDGELIIDGPALIGASSDAPGCRTFFR